MEYARARARACATIQNAKISFHANHIGLIKNENGMNSFCVRPVRNACRLLGHDKKTDSRTHAQINTFGQINRTEDG